MCSNTVTTIKDDIFLKKRIRIKTALNILCIIILIAITAAVIMFVLKYRQILEIKEITVDPDEYPPTFKQALKNNTMILTAKKSERLMLPGTKWCGRGTIAVSHDDLGTAREIDICCRNHDVCSEYIRPGESAHGLENTGFFDWSSCDCDNKFRNCLKDANNFMSDAVGFAYFNFFGPKCLKNEYPIVGCKKCQYTIYAYDKRYRRRCVEPILDTNREKIYQWFDNPLYY